MTTPDTKMLSAMRALGLAETLTAERLEALTNHVTAYLEKFRGNGHQPTMDDLAEALSHIYALTARVAELETALRALDRECETEALRGAKDRIAKLESELAALTGALRNFPHFQDEMPITVEVVAKIAGEYTDMVMTWAPALHAIKFHDEDGDEFEVVYEDFGDETGPSGRWSVPESADWKPVKLAALEKARAEEREQGKSDYPTWAENRIRELESALAAARAPVGDGEIAKAIAMLRTNNDGPDDVVSLALAALIARLARERDEARAALGKLTDPVRHDIIRHADNTDTVISCIQSFALSALKPKGGA